LLPIPIPIPTSYSYFLFLLPIPDPIFHAPDEYSEFPLPVLQNRVGFVIFEKRTSVRGLIGGSRAGRQCCDLAAAGSAGREGAGRQTGWITDRRADGQTDKPTGRRNGQADGNRAGRSGDRQADRLTVRRGRPIN